MLLGERMGWKKVEWLEKCLKGWKGWKQASED